MLKNFGDAERHIKSLFQENAIINFNNEDCKILISGKPTCSTGEPKTDVYVLIESINNKVQHELKISIKKQNADFLENKISSKRAELLFGSDWKSIITNSTSKIKNKFDERDLVYKVKSGKTNKGSITLGWKFELVNKLSGDLSGTILLSEDQALDVYAGINLPPDKKNATVNGTVIENSGIANYVLHGELDSHKNASDVINSIIPVETFIQQNSDIYFACKALNYRTFESKFDGNRPLSVFVDWNIVDGKLTPTLIFDSPLDTKGNEVAEKLLNCLKAINVSNTDDLNESNLSSLNFVVSK
ncbi:hypothetical protein [Paraclostridium sordellii]|uniref:hypothetical protein n=2 Tax=Paraclostridium sordellii TaxID=1505 RepID=UPI0005413540|nr:hypothetical protein [Paeniclostridium sordellii]CEK39975.1 hypothetical protein JGS6382_33031 [[Clostridium] sordellii] [Paeniclostridium sordellii]